MRNWPWSTIGYGLGGTALILAVIWGGLHWHEISTAQPSQIPSAPPAQLPFGVAAEPEVKTNPFFEVLKLVVATAIGLVVTAVHRRHHGDKPLNKTFAQAQVLMCVAAALMMIIIGSNVARALGVAGGASLVRFRTPVEDPKDATILFLLLGLGMASGMGNFAVAGLGAAFLCLTLVGLDLMAEEKPRLMMLDVVATSPAFPTEHVHTVLGSVVDSFEPREVIEGKEAARKYIVHLRPTTSLAYISQELMKEGTAGIKTVSWGQPKKSE